MSAAEELWTLHAAPVDITGVWVRRDPMALGGNLRVLVEVADEWRSLGVWGPEEPISHIFEPRVIREAPLDPMAEPAVEQ